MVMVYSRCCSALINNEMSNIEDIYSEVREEQDLKTRTSLFSYFNKGDHVSISRIQRYCKAGYGSAIRVLENLKEDGLIEQVNGCVYVML